jgi:hypothetical protein
LKGFSPKKYRQFWLKIEAISAPCINSHDIAFQENRHFK